MCFSPNMINSGAPGGLPMTHRAGGESHRPLGHASSDLSEISRLQKKLSAIFDGPGVSKTDPLSSEVDDMLNFSAFRGSVWSYRAGNVS